MKCKIIFFFWLKDYIRMYQIICQKIINFIFIKCQIEVLGSYYLMPFFKNFKNKLHIFIISVQFKKRQLNFKS